MMHLQMLFKLQIKRALRSVSFSRNLVGGFFLGFLVFMVFVYVLILAFSLRKVIEDGFGFEDALAFLNANLFFILIGEFFYRYFLQKMPVIELQNYLHLPIPRSSIVHYMLMKSFISPLSIVMILLFTPFALTEIAPEMGRAAALGWLSSIVFASWAIHWVVMFTKQRLGDNLISVAVMFIVYTVSFGAQYFGWYNAGEILAPYFETAMVSIVPSFGMFLVILLLYYFTFLYYRKVAYLEELSRNMDVQFVNHSLGFMSRFGLAGTIADLEWKLIIRHKKSRNYLFISLLFLFYGIIFYGNDMYMDEDGYSHFFLFIGIFITGIFMFQYGQLFLSWNSANFDFFLVNHKGIEALVLGKYLLFVFISVVCFILSVPYVYYGIDVLFAHMATFLFNMGVNIHLVVLMALWKPKPMDLNKSAMFNYEGVGAAQFLMFFPLMIFPYMIYLPIAMVFDYKVGLISLGIIGLIGIIFFRQLSQLAINNLIKNRYSIATSFRQET
jgi:hypothetical protein